MEWVDRLAAELHLEALRPRARSPAVGVPRWRTGWSGRPRRSRCTSWDCRSGHSSATASEDDAIEDAIHALLLRLPEPEDD